jgi:tRNA(Arg) A34 adenosine deaminase TadA
MQPKTRFFELAKKLSKKSDHHSHKIGVVVTKGNKVISLGFNKLSTHTKSPHPYKSLHAEISALLGVEDVSNCVAYVYRETKDGKPACSKPCPSCESALRIANLKGVFYTNSNQQGWSFENWRKNQ